MLSELRAQTIVVMLNSATDGDFDVFRAHSEARGQGLLSFRNGHRCAASAPRFCGSSRHRHRFELQPAEINAQGLESLVRDGIATLLPNIRALKCGIFRELDQKARLVAIVLAVGLLVQTGNKANQESGPMSDTLLLIVPGR